MIDNLTIYCAIIRARTLVKLASSLNERLDAEAILARLRAACDADDDTTKIMLWRQATSQLSALQQSPELQPQLAALILNAAALNVPEGDMAQHWTPRPN